MSEHHTGHHPATKGSGAARPSTALPVNDAVCGMSVDPLTSKHHFDHAGTVFHFRSPGWRTSFAASGEISEVRLGKQRSPVHLRLPDAPATRTDPYETSPHVKGKASIFLHEGDYTIHHKLAVWFGSEATAISDLAVARSEMYVSIPMFGMIESLGLGTRSGIVLYEIAKHRRDDQSRYRLRGRRGERPAFLPTVILPQV